MLRALGVFGLAVALSGCFVELAAVYQEHHDPHGRPWWCNSQPGHDGGHDHHHPAYDDVEKGMLTWEECHELSQNLEDALVYASQWPTRGEAEADGWTASVNYAAGMGTHHHRGNPLGGTFDPGQPRFLQYDGNGPDAKLVGMSWYVDNGAAAPPEGFVGDNDWWHVHEYLCFQGGLVVYDGHCSEAGIPGSSIYLGNYWMAHAWIVPGWQLNVDVFANHHPCLLETGPAMPHHMCWDMATGGGGHGGHGDHDDHDQMPM